MSPPRHRLLFLASAFAVVLAISLSVVGYCHWKKLERARECRMGISYAILALLDYDTLVGHLPMSVYEDASGTPLGSWRYELLKYVEWGKGERPDTSLPWNSPKNQKLVGWRSPIYCHEKDNSEERLNTNILAITGPGTAFDGKRSYRRADLPPHLIILVEVAHSGTHWLAPGDLSIDDVQQTLTSGLDGDAFMVAFANANYWLLRRDAPISKVKKFMTIESAKVSDREKELGPYVLDRGPTVASPQRPDVTKPEE